MTLIEKYGYMFNDQEVALGCDIHKALQVTCYRTSSTQVWAEVDAAEFCEVRLEINDNLLEISCECRKAAANLPCEHIYATLIAADRGGDLSKATKRSIRKIPVFPNGKAPKTLQKEGKPELNVEKKSAKPAQPAPSPSPSPTLSATDILALAAIDYQPDHITRPTYDIFYVINQEACQADTIQLQTYWRQQRQDGSASPFQPLYYDNGEVWPTRLDDRIMKSLAPFMQTPFSKSGIQVSQAPPNLFVIPAKSYHLLLPLMAKSGRLISQHADDQAIQLDPIPWHLMLSIQPVKNGDYQVCACFKRSEEKMPMPDVSLLSESKIMLTASALIVFEPYGALKWLRQIGENGPMFLPKDQVSTFIKELIETTTLPLPEMPDSLTFDFIDSDIKGLLYIRTAKFKFRNAEQLHADLSFNYNGTIIGETEDISRIMNQESGAFSERNLNQETTLKKFLKSLGFRYNSNPASEEVGWKLLPSKLDEAVKVLVNHDWEIVAEGKSYRKPQEKKARLSMNMDWFELEAEVDYGSEKVPLPELLKSWKLGKEFIQLGDGSFGVLPVEWLKNYTVLTEIGLEKDELITFKRSQILLLDAFLAEKKATNIEFDLQQVKQEFLNFTGLKVSVVPKGFQGQLRHYQQEGLTWLRFLQQFGFGGCLADDMGLGKTVQVLALLETRRTRKTGKPSLVVVPKSLIFNWQEEARRFTPKMTVLIHTGSSRKKDGSNFGSTEIILTTYGTLRRDIMALKDIEFDYCILDESQAIKNADTESAKAVRAVTADYRLTMTGTPIENHLGELLSQFEFLNPGMFGRINAFKQLTSSAKPPTAEELEPLKKAIKPFLLRRKKEEVAKDLPPKTEQVLYCELEEQQRRHYDDLKAYYRQTLLADKESKDSTGKSVEMLEALMRLRQAACHPGLINEKFINSPSAKLDLLFDMIEELVEENHKMLIFSQFTSLLAMVRTHLDNKNINYSYLDGATKDRAQQVDQFQHDDSKKAFLISLKAGGVGLNLTAAGYVFLLDPWWNPAAEAQAIDRAYRIGQKKQVIAYRMIAKDTVEEKVLQMQNRKRQLADSIIQPNSSQIRNLSKEDLTFLLS